MSTIAQRLREARVAAGFDVGAMARLVGIDSTSVDEMERGAQVPSAAILRRYAMVFGTRLQKFLTSGATRSPATLLFRSAAEHGTDLSNVLRASDLRLLGDFLASVDQVNELERLLERPEASRIDVELPNPNSLVKEWEQGRECARRVREHLGLGDDPILSMLALLEDRLHWSLFFVTPDELSVAVQGASTTAPKPAILVNLVGGRESWWRTRVNLAHEMCHVVFDSRLLAQPYLLSPEGELGVRNQWALVERFRGLEKRANSFAVHFLAPGKGIRQAVGGAAPDSEVAINLVCTTFGVGRTVAVRRLGHEYNLSDQVTARMIERGGSVAHSSDHVDAAIAPGLRTSRFRLMVIEALRMGKLDAVEARSLLRIPMSTPIEGAADASAPLVRPETLARARAEAHEWEINRTACVSTDVKRTVDGWDVLVECGPRAAPSQKVVRLSADFESLSLG